MEKIRVIAYVLLIIGGIMFFFVGLLLPIFVNQSSGFIFWTLGIILGCVVLGSFFFVISSAGKKQV